MKSRTYKATGINLKGMPMGESDRLVTVLTKEHGLVRAIAPGARKHKSRLGGRSGLFVVNEALFTRGKSIDKLIQAETLKSFPGLSKDLAKLTASQYLAEIVLAQALTDQPQEELYYLFLEHLSRLETATGPNVLACLAQATFHFLALAGVAPEVFRCCLSRVPLTVELGNPDWQVGFSVSSGGAVAIAEIDRLVGDRLQEVERQIEQQQTERQQRQMMHTATLTGPLAAEANAAYATKKRSGIKNQVSAQVSKDVARQIGIVTYLSAAELALMQQLSKPELILTAAAHIPSQLGAQLSAQSGTIKQPATNAHLMWRHIEQALRQYTQYQFDRPIKSAALIDTCFG